MKKSNEISDLAAKYLAGEMNNQETEKFLEMMDKNKEMKKEFQDLQEAWKKVEPGSELPDSASAWNKLHKRLDEDGLLTDSKIKSLHPANVMFRIAAGIIIFFAISIPAYLLISGKLDIGNNSIRLVAEKNVSVYDLPDGSQVYLKNGSEIYFHDNFLQKREVKLKGEAYFDIMADPSHPFKIETGNAEVTVLGTSFSVRENPELKETEILVESGRVQVNGKNGQELVLKSGDFARAGDNSLSLEKNNNANYLSWKTREFHFENEKLQQVFNLLEEVYKVKISINKKEIGELRITSSYSKQSIDSILQTIGTAFDLNITRKRNSYVVNKN